MQLILGITGLLLAGAITPGPNNLVVMRQAARAGWAGALPAIVGIVGGAAALLAVVAAGGGAALAAVPELAIVIAGAGCLYLTWLGARLIRGSFAAGAGPAGEDARDLPSGVAGLFVFQFLNPKAWVLMVTLVAATRPAFGGATLPFLVGLLAVILPVCLVFWTCLGLLAGRYRGRPAWSAWFDRAMGGLLIASALLLLAGS